METVVKGTDGVAREGVIHLGAWSKTSWRMEDDIFRHLGAWSKTSWCKKKDLCRVGAGDGLRESLTGLQDTVQMCMGVAWRCAGL